MRLRSGIFFNAILCSPYFSSFTFYCNLSEGNNITQAVTPAKHLLNRFRIVFDQHTGVKLDLIHVQAWGSVSDTSCRKKEFGWRVKCL